MPEREERIMEEKGPEKLVSRRENLCVMTVLVILFQGNPRVAEYPMRKANTDQNVLAQGGELDHCRRI